MKTWIIVEFRPKPLRFEWIQRIAYTTQELAENAAKKYAERFPDIKYVVMDLEVVE